jgi:hypothetical protein
MSFCIKKENVSLSVCVVATPSACTCMERMEGNKKERKMKKKKIKQINKIYKRKKKTI